MTFVKPMCVSMTLSNVRQERFVKFLELTTSVTSACVIKLMTWRNLQKTNKSKPIIMENNT